jgi:PAS domain S-box-containing protein
MTNAVGQAGTLQLVDGPLRACLDSLVDSVGVYQAVRDESGRIVDFLIVYANQESTVTTGLSVEQQVGQRLCDVFPDVRRLGYFGRYCELVETGVPVIEGAIERPYGWRELRASRLGDGFLAVWRDISDRKRMERDLQRANAMLNAVIEASAAAIFVKDLEGRYLLVNPVTRASLGRPDLPVVGLTDHDIMSAEAADRLIENDRHVALTGEPVSREEVIEVSGEPRVFLSVKSPLRDASGHVHAICGVATDITELQRARTAAEAASRAKDEFLATVSHELRTPLTAVLGYLRMLEQGAVPAERVPSVLATINRNAQMQLQVIDDILDVSGISAGKLTLSQDEVNLCSLLIDAVNTVRPTAVDKGIEVTYRIPDHDVLTTGDSLRLHQVLWNVLANAVKFTERGGRITAALTVDQDEFVAMVTDTGAGIDPAFLPHMFEPFTQAATGSTRPHNGLGLGLAIVHHLVTAHGGTITVTSDGKGSGATFRISLPRDSSRR